jgi:hypothetical protein
VASIVVAVTISSIASAPVSALVNHRKNGARPRCASARRRSDWKMTIAANPT